MKKTAFITGATSGIGQATALKTAEAGYDLIITGRRKERLEAMAQKIREKGVEVLPLCFDVRNQQEVHQAVQGLTGKKKDYTSLPYSKIQAFSVETSGVFDMDSELELWFSSIGLVKFEFSGGSDIVKIG